MVSLKSRVTDCNLSSFYHRNFALGKLDRSALVRMNGDMIPWTFFLTSLILPFFMFVSIGMHLGFHNRTMADMFMNAKWIKFGADPSNHFASNFIGF